MDKETKPNSFSAAAGDVVNEQHQVDGGIANVKHNSDEAEVNAEAEAEADNTGEIVFDDDDNDGDQGGEKSHTFRQRRLTYTKSHLLEAINSSELQDLDVSDDDDDDDDNDRNNIAIKDVGGKEEESKDKDKDKDKDAIKDMDRSSTQSLLQTITPNAIDKDESKAIECNSEQLESRVLHASAPPIPDHCPTRKRNLLYAHQRLKEQPNGEEEDNMGVGATTSFTSPSSPSSSPAAEWKRRRVSPKDEDDGLPFPRHIVGTYSCHGIEPMYDEGDSTSNSPSCIAKINQDRGGVAFPYANNSRMAVFAAYDGHGDGGEHVAQYALHEIPRRLEQHNDFLKGNFEKAFKDVFVNVDRDLVLETEIEPLYSGCTACVALLKENVLYISNAGDSRAVMASRVKNNNRTVYEALDLTVDQNPDSPGEQERIEQMGGFVSPPPEEGLSARVWLDCNYSQIGLAMSRSIGDHAVKSVGVIAEPVVTKHEMRKEDNFLIIATDGVWEFLSSQEAVDIVSEDLESGRGSSVACQNLIEAAAAMWEKNEGDYRDDITALVIKVKELWV